MRWAIWFLGILTAIAVFGAGTLGHSDHDYGPQNLYLVLLPQDHVQIQSDGTAVFQIVDTISNPVGGYACQDRNFDGHCGIPPWQELSAHFCGSFWVTGTAHGGVFDQAHLTKIFVDPPGSVSLHCGFPQYGTMGHVEHT